jgi:nitrate/TMAO reductase-like tetraheme cytochrome c subunit
MMPSELVGDGMPRVLRPLRRLFGRKKDMSAQGDRSQEEARASTQFSGRPMDGVERRRQPEDRRRSRKKKIAGFISMGVLSIFVGGFIFGAAPLLGMKATDSTDFCISCHTMTHLWEATKRSAHYQNDRGVQVGCPSCHVPHPVANYLQVKMAALKDVYVEMTNPALTKEDYENRRPRLVQKVRDEYLANNSAQCRNCHVIENFTRPIKAHARAQKTGTTCIKCHYNLVHGGELPWVDIEVEEENRIQESTGNATTGLPQGEKNRADLAYYEAEAKTEK